MASPSEAVGLGMGLPGAVASPRTALPGVCGPGYALSNLGAAMPDLGFHSTAEEVTVGRDLTGTTWLVTGVNSGLGRESARVLALRGAHIVGLARTLEKASAAVAELGVSATPVACELSDLTSVRAAVASLAGVSFDGLMANAGIMALQSLQQTLGIEQQLYTNHIGHFVLVTGLLDQLKPGGRVVILSSEAHRMARQGLELDNVSGDDNYHPWRMYGRSKLANILFARSLTRRFALDGSGRTANALHPGVIQTNLARHIPDPGPMFARMQKIEKTIPQGAATQCFVATHPALQGVSGRYFSDCAELAPIPAALDDAAAAALWAWTESVT